jgi:hypothetical protein
MMIHLASLLQNASSAACSLANHARLHYVLPLVSTGGRPMHFLRSGQWINASVHVPTEEILYSYDAEKHVISDSSPSETKRWPWLSVVTRDLDISEFFSSLRVPAEHTLTAANVLMLYAHQKGVLYTRDLEVIGRDGAPIIL